MKATTWSLSRTILKEQVNNLPDFLTPLQRLGLHWESVNRKITERQRYFSLPRAVSDVRRFERTVRVDWCKNWAIFLALPRDLLRRCDKGSAVKAMSVSLEQFGFSVSNHVKTEHWCASEQTFVCWRKGKTILPDYFHLYLKSFLM